MLAHKLSEGSDLAHFLAVPTAKADALMVGTELIAQMQTQLASALNTVPKRYLAHHVFNQLCWQAVYLDVYYRLMYRMHADLAHHRIALTAGFSRGIGHIPNLCHISTLSDFLKQVNAAMAASSLTLAHSEQTRLIADLTDGALLRLVDLQHISLHTANTFSDATRRHLSGLPLTQRLRHTCCRYHLVSTSLCSRCPKRRENIIKQEKI